MPGLRIVETRDLSDAERQAIRRMLDAAFGGDFSDDDWAHALGGWHVLIDVPSLVIAHAAVVERRLLVGPHEFSAGYVEAVAVAPEHQRTGLGTRIMQAATDLVRERFALGALSTGEWGFYERLGWHRWRGPTHVRRADGTLLRSAEEDDGVMVLRCGPSEGLDLSAAIACDERRGDSW